MKFVDISLFIVSLAIGLFLGYIYQPKKKTIYVLPTPDNIEKIQYKDIQGLCYEMEKEVVKCPVNKDLIDNYI